MNPLPDRIAAAIDAYGQDRAHDGDCASRDALIALFAELVSERDRAVAERDAVARHRDELLAICRRDSDAAHDAVLSGREHKFKFGAMLVRDAIAELAAERDRYRDALVARHGGEPLALLSELDAARAERDAAVAKCAGMEQERDHLRAHAYEVEAASGWKVGLAGHPTPADHIRSIVQERDAARRDLESLMAAAKSLTDDPNACWEDFLAAVDAIAAAEQGGA